MRSTIRWNMARAIIEHGIQILVRLDIGVQILADVNVELRLRWLLHQVKLGWNKTSR